MYKNINEFIISVEQFILNKNIDIKENNNVLEFNLFIFNIMNGNKEKINFELNKTENKNKDDIIKSLCTKINNIEEKYNELNKKYDKLNEKYEKIMDFIGPMIKAKEEEFQYKYEFQWKYHNNCELTDNNKKLKKIKGSNDWDTNINGNKILKKNSINIFKIKVNKINNDKSGLYFGLKKVSTIFNSSPFNQDWNLSCDNTNNNSKFRSLIKEEINAGDIVTFIVDLIKGSLLIKKNEFTLGTIYDIPKNEDLVPCVCIYYIGNEVEIID